MAANRDPFLTVETRGGLLPPDFLRRLARGATSRNGGLAGLSPADYHLPGNERLNEAISHCWTRLLGAWAAYRAALARLAEDDPATTVTREKWLLPLFQCLDYGRLQPAGGLEMEGKSYPVSHLWGPAPVHLLGSRVPLDTRTPGVAGAARTSPHGLVQELLNRSGDHLWGFLSNGRRLRILRDNLSLTRQAYVEFDLEAMMEGQVYSDFVLLWLLGHQSRVEGDRPERCWLERWAREAQEQGTRALETLRRGVEEAIRGLGRGFLAHPANRPLRESLRSGALDKQDYYRQLLRTVYRLLFLFVAEDRDLLLVPPAAAAAGARERYLRHYSTGRLRRLAGRRRGGPHPDLWRSLRLVFGRLGDPAGCPELALPALGGHLWDPAETAALDGCDLANADLLEAIRALAYTSDGQVRHSVDYKNLGPEELGSVYEALLEHQPEMNLDAATFALTTSAGHERKTTGSYYTPTSLINALLDSALDPVLVRAAAAPDPEAAILALKVCDPACGSGHFLIAAAHRIARRLAAARTGDEEPSPEALRHALRDVIGACIYGVDQNPMALELCKVNLWLESLEPGRPLSFLDHHLQCGNSLLGATPRLLAEGIPDDAFKPIEGDDKEVCKLVRKENRDYRRTRQATLEFSAPWDRLGDLATGLLQLEAVSDATAEGVLEKERRWRRILDSTDYEYSRLWADAWCAAFVWPKVEAMGHRRPMTEETFRKIERNPNPVAAEVRAEVRRLAEEYRFFHWHLAFPDVFRLPGEGEEAENEEAGWSGGFDVVLGNPPWDRVKLQEKEWFASRNREIADAKNAAVRRRLIRSLEHDDPDLLRAFLDDRRRSEGVGHLLRDSGRYRLTGRGDVNTYQVFAELDRELLTAAGRAGFIVPTGIATDDTTKHFFQDLMAKRSLASLYDFQSGPGLFAEVGHARFKFSLVTLAGTDWHVRQPEFAFFLRDVAHLDRPDRRFGLTAEDIELLNPNTKTCPIFRSARDAEITKAIYRRMPVLWKDGPPEENPWQVRFLAMFHMANDSHRFLTREDLEADNWQLEGNRFVRGREVALPLYEAKMIHHFTHRFGDYADRAPESQNTALPVVSSERLTQSDYFPLPRYWVEQDVAEDRICSDWKPGWLLGWRDICRTFDERTVIAAFIPRISVGHTLPLMASKVSQEYAQAHVLLVGILSSFIFDYTARQKIGGTHLTYTFLKQLPVLAVDNAEAPLPWNRISCWIEWLIPRTVELIYTAWDLGPLARDCGYDGPPFRWDEDRRFLLRCELDAAFFHLYEIDRDDVDYILETFPIVKKKDIKQHGDYRTKLVILDIYDRMQRAIETGEPYQTLLDPPPADPRVAHPDDPEMRRRFAMANEATERA